MSESKPFLQIYGPLHALSSRGLHVRESAHSWKLVLPMSEALIADVRGVCECLDKADAANMLLLLEQFVRARLAAAPRAASSAARKPHWPTMTLKLDTKPKLGNERSAPNQLVRPIRMLNAVSGDAG